MFFFIFVYCKQLKKKSHFIYTIFVENEQYNFGYRFFSFAIFMFWFHFFKFSLWYFPRIKSEFSIVNRLNFLDLIKLVLSIRYNLIHWSTRPKRLTASVSCVDRDRVGHGVSCIERFMQIQFNSPVQWRRASQGRLEDFANFNILSFRTEEQSLSHKL